MPQKKKKTILVVDDDPISLEYSRCVLERVSYQVLRATDGKEAIDILKKMEKDIDLIITDISMPKHDGIELISEVKKASLNLPIVVITGKSHKYHLYLQNELGIEKILKKPVSHHALLQVVGGILRNYVQADPQTVNVSDSHAA